MLRSVLLTAAGLLLASTAQACSCVEPAPLSACEVGNEHAALLVTIQCVKSLICDVNEGTAVADVIIDRVFQDNTGLGFEEGAMTTISSATEGSLCGLGEEFFPGDQWIMFARPPLQAPGNRRLQQTRGRSTRRSNGGQTRSVSARGISSGGSTTLNVVSSDDTDAVFSDGSVCDVMEFDLQTDLCSGNIFRPSAAQVEMLAEGCANPIVINAPDA